MGKLAFVFSGQGAQYTGMGRSLYEGSSAARAVLDQMEQIRPGTLAQCFSGPDEQLGQTVNTQPCVFAVSYAAASALVQAGPMPSAVAGFSLGEVTALTFAQTVDLETGFSLVCRRGDLMDRAARETDAVMLAVLKLTDRQVQTVAGQFDQVYPVNYNCPGQVVVACARRELEPLKTAVKQAGGRVMPLKVSGGFHSQFMSTACEAFAQVLEGVDFASPAWPVYANSTARPYTEQTAGLLGRQMVSPVLWRETVERMTADGVDRFVEVGPGKTLCGLIAKCAPQALVYHVEDMDSLGETAKELELC